KIVAPHEQVPAEWAVHGTTGYRFANVVNGLLIDGDAKRHLDRAWRAFAPDEAEDFDELDWRCRHVVMAGSLAAELMVLSAALLRLARADRRTRDFTLNALRRGLAEVVASFPVYRTYIVDTPSAQDRRFIEWAIGRARRRSLDADGGVFDFIRRVLLGKPLPRAPAELGERYRVFARRLQQYTAPVAAKGVEDTALYRHQRLVSVNDVGGEPDAFGMSVAAFHAASLDRSLHWPDTMLATSTHDAKRSEDVRARIDIISEMPAAWRLAVRRWSRLNRSHKRVAGGVRAPSRNDEYLLYQLLLGSLPHGELSDNALADYAARIEAAMLKSVRESKAVTSWTNPNEAYEAALQGFVQALLGRRERNLFLDDLQRSVAVVAWHGALNGLTLAVVKTLSPGVPDFYQGHEAIELALVDPDNRRPVDFDRRRALLAEAQALWRQPDRSAGLGALLGRAVDGAAKFWVSWRALQLKRAFGPSLARAAYLPLEVRGAHAAHVVAFARRAGPRWVIVVGTRLSVAFGLGKAPLGAAWSDTAIVWPPAGADGPLPRDFDDAISGRRLPATGDLPLADVLREFPVAALFGDANESDEP
ncbi:MAG: malto-oligosyltrehalose synthase, partial [Burkholderiales bacterium]